MKLGKRIFYIFSVFLLIFSFFNLEKVGISFALGTWTEQTASGQRNWYDIASSADGTKLAALDEGGYIYTSNDSGATWVQQTASGQRDWQSIASSSNGVKLAAADYSGYIYTSTDSGATWTEQTASGQTSWYDIASSADGTKLAAVDTNSGYIYTSTDSGATWTEQTASGQRNWYSIASSSDGTKLAAVDSNFDVGYIYTSSDSGVTWVEQTNSTQKEWRHIASSADGTKLAAIDLNTSDVSISEDTGLSWVEYPVSMGGVNSVTMSANGTRLAVTVLSGSVSTSVDGGNSWVEQTGSGVSNFWYSIASSADGTKLAAVATGEHIDTFEADIVTPSILSFSPLDNSNNVSISTNLEIVFDEEVYFNDGYLNIYKTADDSIVQQISINDFTGDTTETISVNLVSDLENGTEYYIQIDADTVRDYDQNSFPGISDETTWNFTTVSAPSSGGGGGSPSYACDDELDNDGDGLVDYSEDPGCEDTRDRNEFNIVIPPPITYICSDGIDNDNDNLIDYPNDPGCINTSDQDESNQIISPPVDEEPTDPCILNPSSCVPPPTDTDPCITNPSSCDVPPPGDPANTCETNPSLCIPPQEDPCILNPESCKEDEIIEEEPILPANTEEEIPENNCENPTQVTFVIWCSFIDSYDFTVDKVGVSLEQAVLILDSENGNFIVKAIGVVGIIFGAVFSVLPRLFANPFSFTEIAMLPYRLWSATLSVFGLKKRVRPWGTVYDSVTKQPLDPVMVSLQSLEGQEIESSITDMDGRYGFFVGPGKYRILPKKTHYDFPSLKLVGKTRDELYLDLYFGDVFEISSGGEVITKNVPMDPIGFDWNEFAKRDQKLMKFYSKRDLLFTKASDIFFSIGFFVSFLAFVSVMNFYNIFIFAVYLLLLFLRETGIKIKNLGSITDKEGNPVSFSVLKVFESTTKTLIAKKVANKYGQYYCLIQQGNYFVEIDQKLPDETYKTVFKSENIDAKKGYINEKFKIDL